MTTARRRLMIDLKKLKMDNPDGISAEPNKDSILQWTAVIQGAPDSIWEGGVFKIALQFPESYPIDPPAARFLTPIFHPNVYSDGRVCVDILQNNWAATNDVVSVLVSLQVLLMCPNPASPANGDAGELFKNNPNEYERKVREVARKSTCSG
jgi:ubiquitin-conjugating enzyme E2 A